MRRVLPLALGALLPVLTVLAGCGGDDGDPPATGPATEAGAAQSMTDSPPANDDHESGNDSAGKDGGGVDDGEALEDEIPGGPSSSAGATTPQVDAKRVGKPEKGDDEAAVIETVERYYQSLALGDNEFACELMSGKAERQIDRLLTQVPRRAGAGRSCTSLLDLLYGQVPEEMLTSFGDVSITNVELNGKKDTRAIAYIEIPGQGQISIRLSFDRGIWRLDQVSGGFA